MDVRVLVEYEMTVPDGEPTHIISEEFLNAIDIEYDMNEYEMDHIRIVDIVEMRGT